MDKTQVVENLQHHLFKKRGRTKCYEWFTEAHLNIRNELEERRVCLQVCSECKEGTPLRGRDICWKCNGYIRMIRERG